MPRIIRNTGVTIVGPALEDSYHGTSVCLHKGRLTGNLELTRMSVHCLPVEVLRALYVVSPSAVCLSYLGTSSLGL